MGIPSVPIITRAYVDLAKSTAAQRGMPTLRIVYTPHPVWGKTTEQLKEMVNGPDPVTGKPMMEEIIADLTTPLTPEDEKSGLLPATLGPATFGPDTSENLDRKST